MNLVTLSPPLKGDRIIESITTFYSRRIKYESILLLYLSLEKQKINTHINFIL